VTSKFSQNVVHAAVFFAGIAAPLTPIVDRRAMGRVPDLDELRARPSARTALPAAVWRVASRRVLMVRTKVG